MTGPVSNPAARARLRYARGLRRYFGRHSAALRRDTDRIESIVLVLLISALLVIGPLLGITTGRWADRAALREQRGSAGDKPVTAVLLPGSAHLQVIPGSEPPTLSMRGRWMVAGRPHSGRVPVSPAARPGQTVVVWVNRAGLLAPPPVRSGNTVLTTALTVLGTEAGLVCVLAMAGGLSRWLIDRRRMTEWDRAVRELTESALGGPGHNDKRRC